MTMNKCGRSRLVRCLFGSTIEQRRDSMGYVFILPWVIGLIWFFLWPMAQAALYVCNEVTLGDNGLVYNFVGTKIIRQVFFDNPNNFRTILESTGTTLINALLIVAFSLIVAVLLNKPFRGRGFCRALVALPIIVSSGVLMQVFKEDLFRSSIESAAEATVFQGVVLEDSLAKLGLGDEFIGVLTGLVSSILDLIWQSGIQILLFVGGMQSISSSLLEVCEVEGASPWQTFWKVTFPMISPFLLLNFVYAVIDSFTISSNPVIVQINDYFHNILYANATTMSVAYFLLVLVVVGLATAIISRRVFYIEK